MKPGSPKRLIATTLVCSAVLGALAALWYQRRSHDSAVLNRIPIPNFQATQAAAENGDVHAANMLGEMCAEGRQVRQDYREAVKWYRKAAESGLAKAQYNLAVLYQIGQGVPRDEAEAAKWYRKAAEQGNADAQYNLAAMYGLGQGVPLDTPEALKWYQRAAEQGDPLARYNLAERYERGKGVNQDLVEAYKWHSLAAQRGLKDGAAARDKLKGMLTSAQVREADNRIREFRAKFPDKLQPGGG